MGIFDEIESVEREYYAARTAAARLGEIAARDSTVLHRTPLRPRDLRDCVDNLEGTFVVRLFAEFEAALRRYWRWVRRRPRLQQTPVSVLLRRVGDRQHVPIDVAREVDLVREFRNSLVHLGEARQQMSFEQCRACLGKFLSNLDHHWLFGEPSS